MLKKTLIGAAVAVALMIPSGLAIAQPWDDTADDPVEVPAVQDQERVRTPGDCLLGEDGVPLHDPDTCPFDHEPRYLDGGAGFGTNARADAPLRLHDPADCPFDGTPQGPGQGAGPVGYGNGWRAGPRLGNV